MPGGEANAVFYLVDQAGLEGIVSKRLGSKYRSGNTTAWLETQSYTVSDLELLGVERSPATHSDATHRGFLVPALSSRPDLNLNRP